jgi:thiosulfate/3-mercaptopyruvate sulfurtransferase
MTTYTTLIAADALQQLMAQQVPLVVLDASFDLADTEAGARAHAAAHLPQAIYVHLDRDLSGPKTGSNGRHPLPERQAFAATAGRWGITPGTQVVVCDRQGGIYAARAWWMLRWLGHTAVAVLDGGADAWQAAGGSMTSAPQQLPDAAAPYPERPALARRIDAAALTKVLGRRPLIDARSAERFRGDVEPLDSQAGHIPGARNRPYGRNLDSDGRFKSAAQLRDEFAALQADALAADVVHSCGSGVTACHNLLAMEHAGLSGSQLYAGSWSEWSADPARPIARG